MPQLTLQDYVEIAALLLFALVFGVSWWRSRHESTEMIEEPSWGSSGSATDGPVTALDHPSFESHTVEVEGPRLFNSQTGLPVISGGGMDVGGNLVGSSVHRP